MGPKQKKMILVKTANMKKSQHTYPPETCELFRINAESNAVNVVLISLFFVVFILFAVGRGVWVWLH